MTDAIKGGTITFDLPPAEQSGMTEQQLVNAGYIKISKSQLVAMLARRSNLFNQNSVDAWRKVMEEPQE